MEVPMRVKVLILAAAVAALSGCATTPAPHLPAPSLLKPVTPIAVPVARPTPKATPTTAVCESQVGQLSSYMRHILVNNKTLAMDCVTKNKASSCWGGVSRTVDQEQRGIRSVAAVTSCEEAKDLLSASEGYLELTGKVARLCGEEGANKCLSSATAQEAISAQRELRILIGGQN